MIQTPVQPVYEITDADKKRQQAIADAWKAYNGELEPPLSKMPGEADDNVLSNRMQAIVDRGVDFLFGMEIEISVEEGAPKEAQQTLDDIWGQKEKRIPLLQKLAMNGAVSGQAFLRIVPDNEGNFRLVVVDPSTVFAQTAPQDCETVLLFCIEYSCTEKINGRPAQVFYREEIALIDPDGNAAKGLPDSDNTWAIQHWTRVGDRGPWTPAGPAIVWPYPFPPLFTCQNLPLPNSFWGKSDLPPDLIGVNNALNLVQSSVNRIEKLYGGPIIFAAGVSESVIDIKPGRIIGLPTTDSKIGAVTIVTDVVNALKFASDLRSDIDEQSSVPGVATGRIDVMPRGSLSGIAIELLFMPLLKKTEKKRCLYGDLILDVSQALLSLKRMDKSIKMTIAWQNPLPHDDLPAVQSALAKKELDISNTTLMRELGYDPDEEMELSQTEDAEKLIAFSRGQGLPPGVPGTPVLPGQQFPAPAAPAPQPPGG